MHIYVFLNDILKATWRSNDTKMEYKFQKYNLKKFLCDACGSFMPVLYKMECVNVLENPFLYVVSSLSLSLGVRLSFRYLVLISDLEPQKFNQGFLHLHQSKPFQCGKSSPGSSCLCVPGTLPVSKEDFVPRQQYH